MPRGAYSTIKEQIQDDLSKIQLVPINPELIRLALRLLDVHPLKVLDSLYLAGALGLERDLKEPVLFVASDRQLIQAAQAEDLRTFNPELP